MLPILRKAPIALAIATIAAFGADNSLGTWKLNVEKSTYMPSPMPVKSLMISREAASEGVKVTITGEQADGIPINAAYTAKYDGKEVRVTGNAPYDAIAVKQSNANILTDTRRKTGGLYRARGRTVVSPDSKTMTMTAKGTGGQGKPLKMTLVFDKQ